MRIVLTLTLGLLAAIGPAFAADKAPAAAAASASAPTPLDKYLDNLKTLRASFLQTLADGQGHEIDRSTGTLIVARPGKFSWDIHPQSGAANKDSGPAHGSSDRAASEGFPSGDGQLMVSDGRNLWFYDRDLEQVSVKSAATALTATPASLLSGDGKITEFFDVSADGKRDDLDWVRVVPRRTDADFREARLGFRGAGTELRRMVLRDKLGQTVTLDFSTSERNANVTDAEVSFTPPPGADVIGTAAK